MRIAWWLIVLGVSSACAAVPARADRGARGPVAPTREECERDGAFVFVPGGAFIAGSDADERRYAYRLSAEARGGSADEIARVERALRARGWFEREQPRTRIEQPAFCMARDLVTNTEYAAFVRATGHRAPGITQAEYQAQGFLVHPYSSVVPYLWSGASPPEGHARRPVVLVSYGDALAYARWRGERDGRTYDLPTREEWERAARGTDGRRFPWGDEWRADAANSEGAGLGRTSDVGAFPASRGPSGANDMAGNVFQYTASRVEQGGRARVYLRGCGWDDLAGFCRAAYEHTRPVESRHILIGFRLVRRGR